MNPVTRTSMRRLGLVVLLIALPLLTAAESPEGELERNARLLARWRQDPDHYARLKRDYRAFMELPPERQARLRQLDHDLNSLPAEEEYQLLQVLERYGAFVESLSEADRQRLDASHGKERLVLIEQLRRERWFEQLPYQLREDLSKLPDDKKARELSKLAEDERRRRWLLTSDVKKRPIPGGPSKDRPEPFPTRPTQLSQYPHEVISFFEYHIRDRLTIEERKRLHEAEGKVGPLAREIVALADRYPVLPAYENKAAVTSWKDLPQDWKKALPLQKLDKDKKGVFKKDVLPYDGKWPDFALAITKVPTKEEADKLSALGPARPADYPPEIFPVLKRLTDADRETLKTFEGKWPDHPLKLHEIARKANLPLPGMSLPGPKAAWDALLREEK